MKVSHKVMALVSPHMNVVLMDVIRRLLPIMWQRLTSSDSRSEIFGLCWCTLITCMLPRRTWLSRWMSCGVGSCFPDELGWADAGVVEFVHVLRWTGLNWCMKIDRHFSTNWDCVGIPSLWHIDVWDSHDVPLISKSVPVDDDDASLAKRECWSSSCVRIILKSALQKNKSQPRNKYNKKFIFIKN